MNDNIIKNNNLNSAEVLSHQPNVKLSKRQKQVLRALNDGLLYKEIAHMHNISENTVAYHMMELRKKLGCNTSREILVEAKALGLV